MMRVSPETIRPEIQILVERGNVTVAEVAALRRGRKWLNQSESAALFPAMGAEARDYWLTNGFITWVPLEELN
jgi:hypothetical protein